MDKIICGDSLEVLKTLKDESVQTCVTSPPYFGLRDYGVKGQIGLEETPEVYVQKLVEVFREVRRVLKDDGTLWLNLGDSYSGGGRGGDPKHRKGDNSAEATAASYKGLPSKNLIGIPWRTAFSLQNDGWIFRQDIIWHKPNPMPESVTDRCTKAHEYIFLLSKSPKYYFDSEAVAEVAVTKENRPAGIVRDREYGYDSKQKTIREMWKEKAQKRPVDSWEKRKAAGAGSGSMDKGHNSSIAKGAGFSHNLGNGETRNRRSVWTVNTKPYKGAHFATFPPDLIKPCILAGAPKDGIVLDPFFGSGTTGAVAKQLGRNYLGIELNPAYIKLAEERLTKVQLTLAT